MCFRFWGSCESFVGTQLTLMKLPRTAECSEFLSTENLVMLLRLWIHRNQLWRAKLCRNFALGGNLTVIWFAVEIHSLLPPWSPLGIEAHCCWLRNRQVPAQLPIVAPSDSAHMALVAPKASEHLVLAFGLVAVQCWASSATAREAPF